MANKIEMRVEELMSEILQGTKYELVDVEYVMEKDWYLRIFVDKAGGIDLDDCQFLSEKIDRQKFYEQVKAACKKLRNKNFVIDKPLRRVITANELPKNLNWRSGDQCNDYKYQ